MKIIIITSSGGGGLLQAALAREQEERDKDPSVIIVKRDMLKDWYYKIICRFAITQWDGAQRTGNVAKLRFLFRCQALADIIFWPRVFWSALRTFFKENMDQVIDTQPVGTSAILFALRIFNYWHKKELLLEKIAVDLPTESNTHFFRPIKKLSAKNRSRLKLVTIFPLLNSGQTEEEFWQQQCNLSKQPTYRMVLRRSFPLWQKAGRRNEPFVFSARIGSRREKELLSRVLALGTLQTNIEEERVQFSLLPHERVVTVLLGSNPANEATIKYIQGLMQIVRKTKNPVCLFVFCAHHNSENSLFSQVAELAVQETHYPSNLTMIPFGVQTDEMIAPLFCRSDITLTRSGGQTAMELMCVMKGTIFIHSETKSDVNKEPTLSELLQGIPGWEAGNALYLHRKYGAHIVTPDTFTPYAEKALVSNS